MKAIVVKNLNRTRAEITIAIKSKQSSMGDVLEQLIDVSDNNGFIEQSITLFDHIEKKINITATNYRTIIHKLTKMQIITKTPNGYQLCQELAGKENAVAICELSYITKK